MTYIHRARKAEVGFSLIEVLIAVVILATGLLALAALQGALSRSSSEAKTRSRVAAMLTARMDELRATTGGYDAIPIGAVTTQSTTGDCDTASPDATDWIDCPRSQANVGSLSVTQTTQIWSSTSGGTNFANAAPADSNDPQFKRIQLSATWTDASNSAHALGMTSDFSPLALTSSELPVTDPTGSSNAAPVVRQDSPATAGVIPIALGNGSSSAASNPTPELVGSHNNEQVVGTRFNVLTYAPSGNAVAVQKRFENEIIKCSCQYGAGGTNLPAIYRTAQWPAIWTGERYDVYKTTPVTAAPGQTLNAGPKSGVSQSPLCQECCRDHHDNTTTAVAKFDPERTSVTGESTGREKYYLNNQNALQLVTNTNTGSYVDSCRVIRVDGFWRTASDMYSRQFGLLETETVAGAKAKTGLPTAAATTAYTNFVKNYLKQYDGTSTKNPPTGAQALFDSTAGINEPAAPGVVISAASTSDYRYLHARGLYVDHLETQALQKLASVISDTGVGGKCAQTPTATPLEDCVLPYLPFTSANLTEIAEWAASDPTVLTVNSLNALGTNPTQPSGGRTIGIKVGSADNTATVRPSNSGIAVNSVLTTLAGVDPTDNSATQSDAQPFQVGGTTNTGDPFYVAMSGGGLNPFVYYTIGADTGECFKSGNWKCSTNTVLNGTTGSIQLSHYWSESDSSATLAVDATGKIGTVQCTISVNGNQSFDGPGNYSVTNFPTFKNYAVSSASVGSGSGSITSFNGVTLDRTANESTVVNFSGLGANSRIDIGFTLTETRTDATVASCTITKQGNSWALTVNSWNKPWL